MYCLYLICSTVLMIIKKVYNRENKYYYLYVEVWKKGPKKDVDSKHFKLRDTSKILYLNNLDLFCTIFLRYKRFIVYIFTQTKVKILKNIGYRFWWCCQIIKLIVDKINKAYHVLKKWFKPSPGYILIILSL